jgi:hypothetical protein
MVSIYMSRCQGYVCLVVCRWVSKSGLGSVGRLFIGEASLEQYSQRFGSLCFLNTFEKIKCWFTEILEDVDECMTVVAIVMTTLSS